MLKYQLLNLKPRIRFMSIFLLISIICLFIILYKVKTYDSIKVTGLITCTDSCQIELTLPYDKVKNLKETSIIQYNNELYNIKDIIYSDPYLSNEMVYQTITFTTNLYETNSLINFKILSNRERIIEKLKNIILER